MDKNKTLALKTYGLVFVNCYGQFLPNKYFFLNTKKMFLKIISYKKRSGYFGDRRDNRKGLK